jgi:TonB family protein
VIVNPDGKAENVTYTRRSGVDVMDYAATGAAQRATYLPAVDNGVPMQEHMRLRVVFNQVCSPAASGLYECFNFNNARGLGRP